MIKAFKYLAIGIAVLSFIAGIVVGSTYGPQPEYSFQDKDFLWSIALIVWVSGGISTMFTWAFALVLEYMEKMSQRLEEIEIHSKLIYRDFSK
ncbi:hypothetical protein J2Z32_004337 [Paenibacillus turicensis]|uniref:Uncharacterized protein n=1 Tax=Paenibacillus turicensis TaxID=160487 RepID=A0ABS4FYK9_9BACL|nr:hypothetical protein [Paenibacillus turicensis]MBP1907657.1 hypothetical protein [Paenibacillus turicensis]